MEDKMNLNTSQTLEIVRVASFYRGLHSNSADTAFRMKAEIFKAMSEVASESILTQSPRTPEDFREKVSEYLNQNKGLSLLRVCHEEFESSCYDTMNMNLSFSL